MFNIKKNIKIYQNFINKYSSQCLIKEFKGNISRNIISTLYFCTSIPVYEKDFGSQQR